MNDKIKFGIAKCLLAGVALAPVANVASAKENKDKSNYKVSYFDNYTFTIKAGPIFVLPSPTMNAQIKANDMEGFNGGAYVEAGVAKWQGEMGKSGNGEVHFEFTGRLDLIGMNSRFQAMRSEDNAHFMATGQHATLNANDFGCSDVKDIMPSLNAAICAGGHGITFDTRAGFGMHLDTHGNFGPVIITGIGLGARINKQMKLMLRYSLHVFPCDNFGSYTRPASSAGLRNTIELGFMYKLQSRNPNNNHRYHNGKQR